MRRIIPLIVLAAAVTVLASGCSAGTTPTTNSRSPTASSPSPFPTPTTAAGCPATPGTTTPAGAVTKATKDIDGDGTADTEWIARVNDQTEIGITTASNATFSYDVSSASPIAPGAFVSKLGGRFISLYSDGRGAEVHVISNCTFVQPKDNKGVPYTFDLQNLRGNGTGVGCVSDNLVGYLAKGDGSTFTVTQTIVTLSADGAMASNGAVSTIASGVPASDSRVKTAESVTCGGDNLASDGVGLQK